MNFHLFIVPDYLHLTTHWAHYYCGQANPQVSQHWNSCLKTEISGFMHQHMGISVVMKRVSSACTCKRFFCCYLHIVCIWEPHAGHRSTAQKYSPGLIHEILFCKGWNEMRIHLLPTKMSTFQLTWWCPLLSILYGSLRKRHKHHCF
jgi:hypothetical protein